MKVHLLILSSLGGILVALVIYAIGAFTAWDADVATWPAPGRFLIAVTMIVGGGLSAIGFYSELDP